MCPNERERRFGMVEFLQLLPGTSGVARFATDNGSIRAGLLHPLFELTLVRIVMADGAGAVLKAVDDRVFSHGGRPFFVAVAARRRDMAAGKLKSCVLVACQCEGGGTIALQGVALVTAIQVRSAGELFLVLVLVAVHTLCELEPVDCVLAFRNVALPALQRGMLQFQRISRIGVVLHGVLGRPEALNRVARTALTGIGPLRELPAVNVFVAVSALLKHDHLLEVAAGVALHAPDCLMFSFQWVLRLGVIKLLLHISQGNTFPAIRVMAGLASLLSEASFVGISMAVTALAES